MKISIRNLIYGKCNIPFLVQAVSDFQHSSLFYKQLSQNQMNSGFSSPTHHKPHHYGSPSIKPSSPNAKHPLTLNTPSTASNKQISHKKEQLKDLKFLNNYPSTFTPTSKKFNPTSPNKSEFLTSNSKYYQSKNISNKGHMYASNSSIEGNPKRHTDQVNEIGEEKLKKMPRMSQAVTSEMKSSNTQIKKETGKVPSFLQERQEKLGKGETKTHKKISDLTDNSQKPDAIKELRKKLESPKNNSMSSSHDFSKENKVKEVEDIDPTDEWVKKSWNRRKEKKLQLSDFEQLKELGEGKYGHVFLVRQKKTNFVCALKIIEKKLLMEEEITEQFIRQLKIQMFLNHPNIIRMFGFFDDALKIYIILEVGTGGQLFKQLKKHQCMPEQNVANVMRQVCQAVNELHSNRIIHRDIKPQNIVLHQNVVKLCDFGWSVRRDEKLRKTFCGTPLYVCPEILRGKEYDEKIDIWSLGVMMYEMLVGENPFKITKEEELIKIIKDSVKIPTYVQISEEARSFLDACLQKSPEQRLNIRELINHEFFKKYPDKNDKKLGM